MCQRLQHLYSKLCFSRLTHAPGSSTKILFSDHTSWALVWKTRSKTSSLAKRLSRYSFLTLLHQWLSPCRRMVGGLGWPWPSLPMSQANCSPFWVKREENHREEQGVATLKKKSLEYSCFTMSCYFSVLQQSESYIYIYIHIYIYVYTHIHISSLFWISFPFRSHRALSRVPCDMQSVLINYLFYTQQCVYASPKLPIHPWTITQL